MPGVLNVSLYIWNFGISVYGFIIYLQTITWINHGFCIIKLWFLYISKKGQRSTNSLPKQLKRKEGQLSHLISSLMKLSSGKPCNFWSIGNGEFLYGSIEISWIGDNCKLFRFETLLNRSHGYWKNVLIRHRKFDFIHNVHKTIHISLQKVSEIYPAVFR